MKSKITKALDFKMGFSSGMKFMGFNENGSLIWFGDYNAKTRYGLNLLNRQNYEANR